MIYDYLIVGSGLAGSTLAERLASQLEKKIIIVEKRNHIGGNCYDYRNEHNINIHKYGPHIFHTMNKKVWDYASKFTDWINYQHKVLAVIGDKKVPIPFNFNSMDSIFPKKQSQKYQKILLDTYKSTSKVPILKLRETNNPELKILADFIYENVFYGYTLKQWGLTPEHLDYSVTSRIPIVLNRDDRYFHDPYQGIPKLGYTQMIAKMITHRNIEILLNTDYRSIISDIKFNKMIYTGKTDEFFDFIHGELPYRSLRYELVNLNQEKFQEAAQVNYPNDFEYTRITEFKHFNNASSERTTIAYEYPEPYTPKINEPYYPIPRQINYEIFSKYKKEIDNVNNTVHFIGRLADYKYYNMDQTIGVALLLFEKTLAKE